VPLAEPGRWSGGVGKALVHGVLDGRTRNAERLILNVARGAIETHDMRTSVDTLLEKAAKVAECVPLDGRYPPVYTEAARRGQMHERLGVPHVTSVSRAFLKTISQPPAA
jgi:hypothetical protein